MNKFEYGVIKSGEEGAEVAQVVIKIGLHPEDFKHEDGNVLYEKLVEEIGDQMASTAWMFEHAPPAFQKRVTERAQFKYAKYVKRFEDAQNV